MKNFLQSIIIIFIVFFLFSHEIYTALTKNLHAQAKLSGEITLKGRGVKTKVYSI